jgi:SpoVK/Ycf46/Vps4 family AAA+-type ATPase
MEPDELRQQIEEIKKSLQSLSGTQLRDIIIQIETGKIIESFNKRVTPSKKETRDEIELKIYKNKIKQPKELDPERRKIDIMQRIHEKYIGEIPRQVFYVILYYLYYDECQKENIPLINRLLLEGLPGTGKTYLFQVIAEELELPSMTFSASDFKDKYLGESSRKIRLAFKAAKSHDKPVLIFIDEIDALATQRKDNTHDENRATLITLLTELQNIHDVKNIFVFAATNDLKALDPAIKDRFSGCICSVNKLTKQDRAHLVQKVSEDGGMPFETKFANRLAEVTNTTGDHAFSNRDIQSIVLRAIMMQKLQCKHEENCDKRLCAYVRKAIDDTGKTGKFASWTSPDFCEGI